MNNASDRADKLPGRTVARFRRVYRERLDHFRLERVQRDVLNRNPNENRDLQDLRLNGVAGFFVRYGEIVDQPIVQYRYYGVLLSFRIRLERTQSRLLQSRERSGNQPHVLQGRIGYGHVRERRGASILMYGGFGSLVRMPLKEIPRKSGGFFVYMSRLPSFVDLVEKP